MVIIVLDKQTINKEGNMGITPQIEGTTIDFYCQLKFHRFWSLSSLAMQFRVIIIYEAWKFGMEFETFQLLCQT